MELLLLIIHKVCGKSRMCCPEVRYLCISFPFWTWCSVMSDLFLGTILKQNVFLDLIGSFVLQKCTFNILFYNYGLFMTAGRYWESLTATAASFLLFRVVIYLEDVYAAFHRRGTTAEKPLIVTPPHLCRCERGFLPGWMDNTGAAELPFMLTLNYLGQSPQPFSANGHFWNSDTVWWQNGHNKMAAAGGGASHMMAAVAYLPVTQWSFWKVPCAMERTVPLTLGQDLAIYQAANALLWQCAVPSRTSGYLSP